MEHKTPSSFDPQAFLDSTGVARTVVAYRKAETIYSQGDACETVLYLQKWEVLARYGAPGRPQRMIPKTSRTTLAEMAGITRARANSLMKKFKRLGFIETDHGFAINNSLLNVVLHD